MLPFLKQRKSGTAISTEYRKPDEDKQPEPQDPGLEEAASDLISAIQSSDKKSVVAALTSFFQILDAMPHVEGPHEDELE